MQPDKVKINLWHYNSGENIEDMVILAETTENNLKWFWMFYLDVFVMIENDWNTIGPQNFLSQRGETRCSSLLSTRELVYFVPTLWLLFKRFQEMFACNNILVSKTNKWNTSTSCGICKKVRRSFSVSCLEALKPKPLLCVSSSKYLMSLCQLCYTVFLVFRLALALRVSVTSGLWWPTEWHLQTGSWSPRVSLLLLQWPGLHHWPRGSPHPGPYYEQSPPVWWVMSWIEMFYVC